ncbi:MAG: hypothetical protein NTW21_41425 [Verrucomicrobia bacterium]|nr:hypothetical protein [Verrucomicrobiota bacterium]
MSNPIDHPQFRKLLDSARRIQARLLFLPSVAVGGTAAALYARHRVSLGVDFVSPALRDHFDEVADRLLDMPEFQLARVRRPVLILGQIAGDEIGLRQLRRAEPLDAVLIDGLWVPTLPEMIRVKAFVLSDRRAVRDFVDVCALVRTAGMEPAIAAMATFEPLYAGLSAAGPLTAFAEAAHDDPADAAEVDLASWRLLDPAYAKLPEVLACVREFALRAIEAAAGGPGPPPAIRQQGQ